MQYEQIDAACPLCKSKLIRRSRHESFFFWLKSRLTHRLPYRCFNCDYRFFVQINPDEHGTQDVARQS